MSFDGEYAMSSGLSDRAGIRVVSETQATILSIGRNENCERSLRWSKSLIITILLLAKDLES